MTSFLNVTGPYVGGGAGDDEFTYDRPLDASTVVDGAPGHDRLTVSNISIGTFPASFSVNDTFDGGTYFGRASSGYSPELQFFGIEDVRLDGTALDDVFDLKIGQQTSGLAVSFNGGAGTDQLNFDSSRNSGNAVLSLNSDGSIDSSFGTFVSFEKFRILTGAGNDVIHTGDAADYVASGGGTDMVSTGGGGDEIYSEGTSGMIDAGEGYDYWSGNFGGSTAPVAFQLGDVIQVSNGLTVANAEYVTLGTGAGGGRFDFSRYYDGVVYGGSGIDVLSYSVPTDAGRQFTLTPGTGGTFAGAITLAQTNALSFSSIGQLDLHAGAQADSFSIGTGTWAANALRIDGGGGVDALMVDFSGFNDASRFIVGPNGVVDSNRGTFAGFEDISLFGGDQADVFTTGSGDDYLNGGGGSDRLEGGAGDDRYSVDQLGDVVIEGANGGHDQVLTSIDYALPANVEDLIMSPSIEQMQITGTGNDADNSLYGSVRADHLFGLGGSDHLIGDFGDDTLDGGAGNDLLVGGDGADVLTGGAGRDIFQGTQGELNGDTITDLSVGDKILFTDANASIFRFSLTGNTLTFGSGGSLTATHGLIGALVASSTPDGLVLTVTAPDANRPADFDGNAHSDFLWRNTNGAVSTWTVSGDGHQVQQGAYNGYVDTSWHINDTLDFNGDGRADILFRQSGGAVAVWDSTGGGFDQSSYYLADPVPTDWRIAGTGDVTGDGKDDLIWQRADGVISTWNSTGTGFQEAAYNHGSVGTAWQVEGLADFNGDGLGDILWRNTDGSVSTWLNDARGGFVEGSYYFAGVPTSWHIDGTGDFDGDGKADLLWRNDNGAVSEWRSNGSGFDQSVYNSSAPTDWHIAATGDFNDDGRADILFHNDDGRVSTWQSNGAGFDQSIYNAAAPTDWSIAAHTFVL